MIDQRAKSGVFAAFIEVWQQNRVFAAGLALLPAVWAYAIEYEKQQPKVQLVPSRRAKRDKKKRRISPPLLYCEQN